MIVCTHSHSKGLTAQLIWHKYLHCSSSDSCINDCQTCPTNGSVSCSHSQDVTVACSELTPHTLAHNITIMIALFLFRLWHKKPYC